MPEKQTEVPIDSYIESWLSEVEAEQADKPQGSDSLYKGWFTPVPDTWLPDWIKSGYNNSIEGLAQQIRDGKPVYQISEDYTPGMWADIGSTLISFVQPADLLAMSAGGVGGLALKASTKQAAKMLVKSGVKKNIAENAAARGHSNLLKRLR